MAERKDDVHSLADVLTGDAQFGGPAGRILGKAQSLERFVSGDLKMTFTGDGEYWQEPGSQFVPTVSPA